MAINLQHPHHMQVAPARQSVLRAQRLVASDPDAAALALDGALRDLLYQACGGQHAAPCAPDALLHLLDEREPDLSRRFRLALRAPHIEARLAHLWALIDLVNAAPPGSGAHACH